MSDEVLTEDFEGDGIVTPVRLTMNEDDFGCTCVRCQTTRVEGEIPLWDDDPGRRILMWTSHLQYLAKRGIAATIRAPIGVRTAADLKWGAPPKPLIPPFFTTESAVVLYGPGGVGKGTMAAYLIREYLRLDDENVVMVLDFEGHESEWGNRLRGLGCDDYELERIHYREPFGVDWELDENTISESAEAIRRDAVALDVGLLVVDSIVMASDGDAAMGGAAGAKAYFAGLASIGLRSLNLGHVAGAAEKWPAKPFGSTYVHNLARETWAIERVGDDDEVIEDRTAQQLSSTFRVELRNRKNSEGAKQRPVVFDITYFENGDLSVVPATNVKTPKDLITEVLRATPGLTVSGIVAAIKEDTGDPILAKTVTNALTRSKDTFEADKDARPFKWSLR